MSKPKRITIDEVAYVREDSVKQPDLSDISIIRCRNAGVHVGRVIDVNDITVEVKQSRRLWRWWSQFTLSELAVKGPDMSHASDNQYACQVESLTLITSDVCEIIPCTLEAANAIYSIPDYTP